MYAGVDLHSNNGHYGVIDDQDRRVFAKRLPNDLATILTPLSPFQKDLDGVAVESTYNWYWLVDGLMETAYPTLLANPASRLVPGQVYGYVTDLVAVPALRPQNVLLAPIGRADHFADPRHTRRSPGGREPGDLAFRSGW